MFFFIFIHNQGMMASCCDLFRCFADNVKDKGDIMLFKEKIVKIVLLFAVIPVLLFASADKKNLDSIRAERSPDGKYKVTFIYNPGGLGKNVCVVGSFNHWKKSLNQMKGPDKNGNFSTILILPSGTHHYKFVIDDKRWVHDPLNELKLDDGHEGYNSVLLLGDARINDVWQAPMSKAAIDPNFKTPGWAKNIIWYQIFPERFRNGTKKNDPDVKIIPWTSEWKKIQPWEKGTFYNPIVWNRRYGGDLQGVMEKLDCLQSLGVTAIYFNPLFEAPSLHKYDATTYMHIDDNFGFKGDQEGLEEDWFDASTWKWTKSDKYFIKLVKEIHKRGMYVIIDGVFNHVADINIAFLDVKKNGKKSKFADWFDIISWEPFKHQGWADFDMMPEFKEGPDGFTPSLTKHLFDVTSKWMDPNGDGDPSDGIDGWRLDVPFDVNRKFWKDWRDHVKSINPDAYLTGELWGSPASWLTGDAFDASMNYDFSRISQNFFIDKKNKISVTEFDWLLKELHNSLPLQSVYVMQNLFDSHDTDRLASQIINPDRPYDSENRVQDKSGENYDESKPSKDAYRVMKLMTLFQMCWVGAPMIYNGNEVGMFGADDPSNRKPMLWKDKEPYENPGVNFVDKDVLEWHRKCIAIRNTFPALRTGIFKTALIDDKSDVYAFWREEKAGGNTEKILIVLNNSKEKRDISINMLDIPETSAFMDCISSKGKIYKSRIPFNKGKWNCIKYNTKKAKKYRIKDKKISISLEPKSAAILVEVKDK
jgi:cyclomaltodextrinase / maltogenic alpha-amylase / neopullulanase